MGCGASSASPGQAKEPSATINNSATVLSVESSLDTTITTPTSVHDQTGRGCTDEPGSKVSREVGDCSTDEIDKLPGGKCFVAFDVTLDGDSAKTTPLDSLISIQLPPRLKHLEPLPNAPQLTADMLMNKLEKAEEKRKKALARKKELCVKRLRARTNLIDEDDLSEQDILSNGTFSPRDDLVTDPLSSSTVSPVDVRRASAEIPRDSPFNCVDGEEATLEDEDEPSTNVDTPSASLSVADNKNNNSLPTALTDSQLILSLEAFGSSLASVQERSRMLHFLRSGFHGLQTLHEYDQEDEKTSSDDDDDDMRQFYV